MASMDPSKLSITSKCFMKPAMALVSGHRNHARPAYETLHVVMDALVLIVNPCGFFCPGILFIETLTAQPTEQPVHPEPPLYRLRSREH